MPHRLPVSGARRIVGARIAADMIGDTRSWISRDTFAHRDAPELQATLKRVRETGSIDPKHGYRAIKTVSLDARRHMPRHRAAGAVDGSPTFRPRVESKRRVARRYSG